MWGGSFEFQFINGTLPLTVYWDKQAFYSDSLPFADSLQPTGMGFLHCNDPNPNYDNCDRFYPYYMTDDPEDIYPWDSCAFPPPDGLPYRGPAPCTAVDSMVFYGTKMYTFQLEIVPYGSNITSIGSQPRSNEMQVTVSPNPVANKVNIEWQSKQPATIRLIDLMGNTRAIKQQGLSPYTMDVHRLRQGIYLLQLQQEEKRTMRKILIQR